MKKNNLLITCTNIKDTNKINELDLSKYKKIIVASNNYKVHKYCKKLNSIHRVIFLNKSISYPRVSSNVIKIIERVNAYFAEVSKLGFFHRDEIFWHYFVEGGYTTQRVQDVLLSIESAIMVLEENDINEVITIGKDSSNIIKIYKIISAKKSLKIRSYDSKIIFNKSKIKDILRPIYFLLRALICKLTSKKVDFANLKNLVIFQIFGSSQKHVKNAIFSQDEFLRKGYSPLNLIWGNTREVRRLNKKGYKTLAIESYLNYYDIIVSLYKTLLVLTKARTLKKLFFNFNTFSYKNIDITDMVFASSFQYLYTDGPENYRYRRAANRFASNNLTNLVAIRYSEPKFFNFSTILPNAIKDEYLKFDYNVGLVIPDSYVEFNFKKNYDFLTNNFIRFVPNEIVKKYFVQEMNMPETNIIKFGAGRSQTHFQNLKSLSKKESKKKIGVTKNYDVYILADYGGQVSGIESIEEIVLLLSTLIDYAKNHQNIALIIKPHPSADLDILKELIEDKSENIYLIDKKLPPDDALNIADVMFCKFTTMGIEAMVYDVQVVSILLDNEKIFKVYGEAAEYINCKEDLTNFLKNTIQSKDTFIEWKNSYAEKRKKFISEYYPKIEKTSAKIMQESITRNITSLKK